MEHDIHEEIWHHGRVPSRQLRSQVLLFGVGELAGIRVEFKDGHLGSSRSQVSKTQNADKGFQ